MCASNISKRQAKTMANYVMLSNMRGRTKIYIFFGRAYISNILFQAINTLNSVHNFINHNKNKKTQTSYGIGANTFIFSSANVPYSWHINIFFSRFRARVTLFHHRWECHAKINAQNTIFPKNIWILKYAFVSSSLP